MANTEVPTGAPILTIASAENSRLKSRAVQEKGHMCNRSWIYAIALTILFALLPTASHGQEAVGKATSVRPQAEGSHGGTRTLSGGADVYSRETVRTGDTGQADLQFHDKSNLT